jgi:hypothetical protein
VSSHSERFKFYFAKVPLVCDELVLYKTPEKNARNIIIPE